MNKPIEIILKNDMSLKYAKEKLQGGAQCFCGVDLSPCTGFNKTDKFLIKGYAKIGVPNLFGTIIECNRRNKFRRPILLPFSIK